MKRIAIIFLVSLIAFTSIVFDVDAAVRVNGYYRKNGTYVQPYYRSNPDGNPYNNWSFPGNTNPYTGKVASGNPDTYLNNYYNGSSGGLYSLPSVSSYVPSPSVINVPTNAYSIGTTWYCNNRYRQVGGSCQQVVAPLNATIYGSTWYCNNGYKQVGSFCEKVIAPANATVYGSIWYCNSGYKQVGNSCQLR